MAFSLARKLHLNRVEAKKMAKQTIPENKIRATVLKVKSRDQEVEG